MRWHEITIHTTEQAIEMISNFLDELGAGGVSIEESGTLNKERDTTFGVLYDTPFNDIPEGKAVIKGYFSPEAVNSEEVLNNLRLSIEQLREFEIDPGEATIELKDVDDEDWADAWKQYFKPVRVTDRLTIKPTWEAYSPDEDELIIEIDPGMAFGTGTHPTTALCLRSLEQVIQGGEEVIDVGTGSGVLAIGALKLGAGHVLAVDLDPVAVTISEENLSLNDMQSKSTVRLSDLLSVFKASDEEKELLGVQLPVKIVVANILAEIILLLIDDVKLVLEKDGYFISSGIYKNKEDVVREALVAAGFRIEATNKDQDWVAFVARKE